MKPLFSSVKKITQEQAEATQLLHSIHRQVLTSKQVDPVDEDLGDDTDESWLFKNLPISNNTKQGLFLGNFVKMLPIQKATLLYALAGRDILGASKTGSGKTLAFLIPVLEFIWRNGFTSSDGLIALILSPTRELASQTFQVLTTIGQKHSEISSALVIGGTKSEEEKESVVNANILVCTPGRLIEYMGLIPNFYCENLRILVLDEADRMLDMGFQRELNTILKKIPKDRQTLLFSATQKASVSQLARLSLKEPKCISTNAHSTWVTPLKLTQYYTITPLNQKVNALWTFIKKNLDGKILVFVTSQKQVRFLYEAFSLLKPGLPVMQICGQMAQKKRLEVFHQFQNTDNALLFATDLAARGLDFQKTDWVVQFDCPENVDVYIHRCGRTARNKGVGSALLLLCPSEEAMVQLLESSKIPIQQSQPDPSQIVDIKSDLQALLLQNNELTFLAKKSVRSYFKSISLMGNKQVFNADALPAQEFWDSLGLQGEVQFDFSRKTKADSIASNSKKRNRQEKKKTEGNETKQPKRRLEKRQRLAMKKTEN